MTRSIAVFSLLLGACGTSQPAQPTTPADAPAQANATAQTEEQPASTQTPAASEAAAAAPAMEGEIVALARSSDTVEQMELRLDDKGTVIKQSLYHRDESAVPQAVRDLAKQKFPGAKTKGYELEKYPTGLVYEVEVTKKDGTQCELAAREDGTEVYTECHIRKSELPKPVAAKVKELYPKGKIEEVETKKGPDMDLVTVEVVAGGKEYYLHFSPDGALVDRYLKIPAVVEVQLE